jgi:polyhydroxyalkanoate synthesis regulator phasin
MSKKTASLNLGPLKRDLRKVVLAGVGAALLAKEGTVELARKFMEKGEDVEPQIKKTLKSLSDHSKAAVKKTGGSLKTLGESLPLVTRKDWAAHTDQIKTLALKIDALARMKNKRGR